MSSGKSLGMSCVFRCTSQYMQTKTHFPVKDLHIHCVRQVRRLPRDSNVPQHRKQEARVLKGCFNICNFVSISITTSRNLASPLLQNLAIFPFPTRQTQKQRRPQEERTPRCIAERSNHHHDAAIACMHGRPTTKTPYPHQTSLSSPLSVRTPTCPYSPLAPAAPCTAIPTSTSLPHRSTAGNLALSSRSSRGR